MTSRQDEILTLARRHGRVWVEELAAHLGTTPQTIRKDLRQLEAAGELSRFHGGASLRAGLDYVAYDLRRSIAAPAKDAIARAAVAELAPGASVFINAGTTTESAARALDRAPRLKIITDNVNIANITRKIAGISTIVAGGEVRASDGAVVGAAAVAFLDQFQTDVALIGAAAISPDGALLDYDLNEAMVVRAMVRNARRVILLADATKIGGAAPVRIGHMTDMDMFITDHCPDPGLRDLCAQAKVTLVETAPAVEAKRTAKTA